jgi:hypothetical protein
VIIVTRRVFRGIRVRGFLNFSWKCGRRSLRVKKVNKANLRDKKFTENFMSHLFTVKSLIKFVQHMSLPYRRTEVTVEVKPVYDGGHLFFKVIYRSKFLTIKYMCFARAFTAREMYGSDIPYELDKYREEYLILIFAPACSPNLYKRNIRVRPLHKIWKPLGAGPYHSRIGGQVCQTNDPVEAEREIAEQVKALHLRAVAAIQQAAEIFFPSLRETPPTYAKPSDTRGWIPDTGPGPPRLLSSFLPR